MPLLFENILLLENEGVVIHVWDDAVLDTDDVEALILLPLNDDDEAFPPLPLGDDAKIMVALPRDDGKVADPFTEIDSCVSIVEAESDLVLCVFEEEAGYCIVLVSDEAKLLELLEICDEEAFVDEENLEDNEVVVTWSSAATALIIHIVVQIIVVLGLKSLMVFLVPCAGSNFSCHMSKERKLM